ncbi:MAG: DnaJ C-terminal domain-containing protein [Spirochaetota bacterium]
MDPYAILGVSKTATDDEIKKAYRNLAKKYHPDLNPNNKQAEQEFKKVSAAYELIGTKEAREKFEKGEFNEQFADSQRRSGPFYHEFQDADRRYTHYYEGDDEDFLKSFFSGFAGKGRSMDVPGQDHLYKMEIELKDAVLGNEQEIMLAGGQRLKVKIPAGVEDGAKLRFKGRGGAGTGKGKPGDAYVEIFIKPSKDFKLEGNDLEIEVPVTVDEAVNGLKIKIPTIDGAVMLTIPPGANTGTKLRVKGKGMPHGKERGDQIVVLKVVLPEKIDPEFNEFIKRWSKDHPYNPREKSI